MKVGYLTYGLDRSPTGIGRYAVSLLEALSAMPHGPEMVLLTTEQRDSHGLWDRFPHVALRGCSRLPAMLALGPAALAAVARSYGLDLIHDPNGIAPFLGANIQAARVVTIHDAFPLVEPRSHNRVDVLRYRWHLGRAARAAQAVITVSDFSRTALRSLLRLSDDRLHVIAHGVDARFSPIPVGKVRDEVLNRYGIDAPFVLYVGGITERKNIARLFEAFAQVVKLHPKVRLVIAGRRQWRTATIEAAFVQNGLEPSVIFAGYVPDEDLPALYSAARMLVFPSLYEGFGLPPLEAMACATPVITSTTTSLPEVVADAAIMIDPLSVPALITAINQLLNDDVLHARLTTLGPQRAAQFSWARSAAATVAVYASLG